MIFPCLAFWRYSPRNFLCRVIWNCSELMRLPCPYAPQMFGFIVGARAVALSLPDRNPEVAS